MSGTVWAGERNEGGSGRGRLLAAVALGLCLVLPGLAWAEVLAEPHRIAAAGFGREADGVSTITVKVYDLVTGAVLSDDTYELDVKDEAMGTGPHPQARIFAGGVGPDAVDLSNFVLRVYDAQTGRFQWEGQLNLVPVQGEGAIQKISTVAPRRVAVTRISVANESPATPSFLLRARDPVTGVVMWKDEFSTDGRVRLERLFAQTQPVPDTLSESLPAFEFRIRMFEAGGQRLLWEDEVRLDEGGELVPSESTQEQATMLPNSLSQTDRLGRQESI